MHNKNVILKICALFSIIVLHCFLFMEISLAQEERWTHYGLRPLAMGNAFVAVVDDHNALYYNPAGLAKLKTWHVEVLNPYLEISSSVISIYEDIADLTSGSSGDTSAVLDLLDKYAGKTNHIGLGWRPYLVFPHFGLGLATDFNSTISFHRYPSIYLNFGGMVSVPVAYAMSFLNDRLLIGAAIKFRGKAIIDHEFSIQDIEAFKKDDNSEASEDSQDLGDFFKSGHRISSDVGLLFTPIQTMEPTLGISIANIVGTSYRPTKMPKATKIIAPSEEIPSVNVGISLKPWQSNKSYILTALDVHEINKPYSFSKKFNVGVEWGLGSIFKIDAGLHQGYLSTGFQIDAILLKLRFVTYAEEVGPAAGVKADRRYALQFKLLI